MTNCVFCGRETAFHLSISFLFSFNKIEAPFICTHCFNKFVPIDLTKACLGCARSETPHKFCSDCQKWQKRYPTLPLKHTALFTYNDIAKEFMEQFKFQGDLILAKVFAKKIHKALKNYENTHHLVPIPTSDASMENRGFNQVELILKKSGIRFENWLSHVGDGEKQSSKNRHERLVSKQPFKINNELADLQPIHKPLLIVDDVYTTGRTILHARNIFDAHGEKLAHQNESTQQIKTESFSFFR